MGRNKHIWHCGHCNHPLHVTKAKKGTKYLYCPHCQAQVAYFNAGILGTLAKGALKAIPGVGTAISLGETAYDLYKSFKGDKPAETASQHAPVAPHPYHRSSYPTNQRVHDALR